jgi:hypothetical protein
MILSATSSPFSSWKCCMTRCASMVLATVPPNLYLMPAVWPYAVMRAIYWLSLSQCGDQDGLPDNFVRHWYRNMSRVLRSTYHLHLLLRIAIPRFFVPVIFAFPFLACLGIQLVWKVSHGEIDIFGLVAFSKSTECCPRSGDWFPPLASR